MKSKTSSKLIMPNGQLQWLNNNQINELKQASKQASKQNNKINKLKLHCK